MWEGSPIADNLRSYRYVSCYTYSITDVDQYKVICVFRDSKP